jgi:transcriptional regulator with XRE-family HTH domain
MSDKVIHQGRAVKRIREILGKKQEELAVSLGITQQAVSLLEGKEVLDPKILEDVAKVLHVTPDAIRNFDEDAAVNIVANTINNHDQSAVINYQPTFNTVDKIVDLYERMIREKDDKIALLEKLLADKK